MAHKTLDNRFCELLHYANELRTASDYWDKSLINSNFIAATALINDVDVLVNL